MAGYTHTDWSCRRKQQFATPELAQEYIDTKVFPRTKIRIHDLTPLVSYKCDYGEHWHVCKLENHVKYGARHQPLDRVQTL